MTSPNEPVQPVGYVAPPAQGGSASGGGGTFAPPAFAPPAFAPPAFAPPAFAAPGLTSPTAQPGLNTMAVLALVFVFVFSPLGVVFGVIGRRQIARTGERGKGLATAGLILGAVFTLLGIVFAVLVGVAVAKSSNSVSRSAVESQVAAKYETTVGTRPDSVSCATDLEATVGATDLCTAVTAGTSTPVKVVVASVVGNTVNYNLTIG